MGELAVSEARLIGSESGAQIDSGRCDCRLRWAIVVASLFSDTGHLGP